MYCKECNKELRSDNSVGFCVAHRSLAVDIQVAIDNLSKGGK